MRPIVMTAFLVAICLALLAVPAAADSFWDHNGSLMRLKSNGQQRVFTYDEPRSVLRRAGVRGGTVLFDGRNVGDYYVGRARRFSKYCEAPLVYEVEGPVLDGTRIVMRGTREVFASGCRGTGRYVQDELVFTYSRSD